MCPVLLVKVATNRPHRGNLHILSSAIADAVLLSVQNAQPTKEDFESRRTADREAWAKQGTDIEYRLLCLKNPLALITLTF